MEEAAKGEEDSQISINPKDFKISPNTVGFFIAQSAEEVKRWGREEGEMIVVIFWAGPGGSAKLAMRKWGTRQQSRDVNVGQVSQPC